MKEIGRWCRVCFWYLFFVLQPLCVLSQGYGVGEAGVQTDLATLDEYFEYLSDNPVAINSADRAELERLMLLSDFQIESILDYRLNVGDIYSAAELSLLYGFDEESVEILQPFILFTPSNRDISGNNHNIDAYVRVSGKLEKDSVGVGSPYGVQFRAKYQYGKHIFTGFLLDNDAGEYLFVKGAPFVDFVSGHLAIKDYGCLKTFILGDFSARFGQGLLLWKSFSFGGIYAPSYMCKRGNGVMPYTSSDENNFFRGAAASLAFGKIGVSVIYSSNRLDARVVDGKYTSLPQGGLHNTESSLRCRKTMREDVVGLNVSYLFHNLKIELSGLAYSYNKGNGRAIREDNKYQMYDGWWGNCSFSFSGILSSLRFFGEAAIDYGGSCALLVGAVSAVSDDIDLGVMLRNYSKSYIAPHGSAYSTLSDVANQRGVTLNCTIAFKNSLKLDVFADAVHYPWKRYNVNDESFQIKGSTRLEYSGKIYDWNIRLSDTYASHNCRNKVSLKGSAGYWLLPGLYLKGRVAAAYSDDLGWMASIGLKYEFNNGNIVLQGGNCYFCCDDWDSRLYNYEADLPYTYNSRLLYGEGGCCFLLIKCRLFKGAEIYLKGDTIQYIASEKDSVNRLKMAVRYKF